MRLSDELINRLKALLKEEHGLDCTDEEAQTVGMAVMRFVLAKTERQRELTGMEKKL